MKNQLQHAWRGRKSGNEIEKPIIGDDGVMLIQLQRALWVIAISKSAPVDERKNYSGQFLGACVSLLLIKDQRNDHAW